MVHYMKSLIIKDICGVCFFFSANLCNPKRSHLSMSLPSGGGGFCWIGSFRVHKATLHPEQGNGG